MSAGPRMLQDLRAIVTTWPFVASVLVMVINDAWLKSAYPGILTGKLSDLAGIATVGLLLLMAQPERSRLIQASLALAFAWWKSPLSQPAIDAVNAVFPFAIGRTVDYSDLLALLILPLCARVTANPDAFQVPGLNVRRVLLAPIVALTMFGLMATSMVRMQQDFQIRRTTSSESLDRQAVADVIARVARAHGLECLRCEDPANSASYTAGNLFLEYSFPEDRAVSFKVETHGKSEDGDRLRADLKKRLASLYRDLEYVEPLAAPAD